jgi:hypothetical protein
MKKIVLILTVLGAGYYYFQGNENKTMSVSEVISISNSSEEILKVTGEVKSNFKLFYGIYELKDVQSGESIMISTKGDLPKVGTVITSNLKKNDVITINDKTFSLFEEVD